MAPSLQRRGTDKKFEWCRALLGPTSFDVARAPARTWPAAAPGPLAASATPPILDETFCVTFAASSTLHALFRQKIHHQRDRGFGILIHNPMTGIRDNAWGDVRRHEAQRVCLCRPERFIAAQSQHRHFQLAAFG